MLTKSAPEKGSRVCMTKEYLTLTYSCARMAIRGIRSWLLDVNYICLRLRMDLALKRER